MRRAKLKEQDDQLNYDTEENERSTITVEDYKEHSQEFFDKYFYVAKELGEGAKAEDILKIMESLAGVVMKKRSETKVGPFGFNKNHPKRKMIQTDTQLEVIIPEVQN